MFSKSSIKTSYYYTRPRVSSLFTQPKSPPSGDSSVTTKFQNIFLFFSRLAAAASQENLHLRLVASGRKVHDFLGTMEVQFWQFHRKSSFYLPLGSVNLVLKLMGTPDGISNHSGRNRIARWWCRVAPGI